MATPPPPIPRARTFASPFPTTQHPFILPYRRLRQAVGESKQLPSHTNTHTHTHSLSLHPAPAGAPGPMRPGVVPNRPKRPKLDMGMFALGADKGANRGVGAVRAAASPVAGSGRDGDDFVNAHVTDSINGVRWGVPESGVDETRGSGTMFVETNMRGDEDVFLLGRGGDSGKAGYNTTAECRCGSETSQRPASPAGTAAAAASPSSPTPSKKCSVRYGNLRQTAKIGRGQFGDVWRVVDATDPTSVFALKKVSFARSAEEVKNLKWSKKPRTHLVTSHTAFWSKSLSQVCILMEYMPYGSLKDYVAKNIMSPVDVHVVAMSLMDALHYLRARHVVHRDIKPANVLIGLGGVVKVADFGVSRVTEKHDNSLAYTLVGTESWMAPERLRNEPYSYPSDVYSVGMVLAYLALGGKNPIQGALTESRQVCLRELLLNKCTPQNANEEGLHSVTYDERISSIVFESTELDPDARPTADDVLAVYRRDPCFADMLRRGDYGIDVRKLRPFHHDDLRLLEAQQAQASSSYAPLPDDAAAAAAATAVSVPVSSSRSPKAAPAVSALPAPQPQPQPLPSPTPPSPSSPFRGCVRADDGPGSPQEMVCIGVTSPGARTRASVASSAVLSSAASSSSGSEPCADAARSSRTRRASLSLKDACRDADETVSFCRSSSSSLSTAPTPADKAAGGRGAGIDAESLDDACCTAADSPTYSPIASETDTRGSGGGESAVRPLLLLGVAVVFVVAGLATASTVMEPDDFSRMLLPLVGIVLTCVACVFSTQRGRIAEAGMSGGIRARGGDLAINGGGDSGGGGGGVGGLVRLPSVVLRALGSGHAASDDTVAPILPLTANRAATKA